MQGKIFSNNMYNDKTLTYNYPGELISTPCKFH